MNAARCWKATGLDCRQATTVPRIRAGSSSRTNCRTATMGTYSPPWMPAVTPSTGPGSAPWVMTTGSETVLGPRPTTQ